MREKNKQRGCLNALPEDRVTIHSGDMGDTLPPRRGHALEGVSRGGRASPVRRPPAGRREDDGALRRVRDLAEDGLQDLRPLQGLRRPRAHRPQPTTLSARQPAPAGPGNADCPAEEGLPRLGRAQDPREAARPVRAVTLSGHQHRARGARSPRLGAASGAPTPPRDRARRCRRPARPMRSGVRITKASFDSATGGTATR